MILENTFHLSISLKKRAIYMPSDRITKKVLLIGIDGCRADALVMPVSHLCSDNTGQAVQHCIGLF